MNIENKKANLALWIGLVIPIVALLFIAVFSFSPATFSPKYDFLYSMHYYNDGYCLGDGGVYQIKNQTIVIASTTELNKMGCNYTKDILPPKIYRYDVQANKYNLISLEEAQKLKIDSSPLSPDEISIQRGDNYNAGIFEIFGGNNNRYNMMFLKNNKEALKKIDVGAVNIYDFIFIGWII